jgi:hypothetical protein
MKLIITSYHAVATWKWDTSTEEHKLYHYAKTGGDADDDDDDDDDDVCGICRLAYESTCPECKVPGDDCPLSEVLASAHLCGVMMLVLIGSLGRMHAYLPHALSSQVDRHRIFEAAVPNGPETVG